MSKSKRVLSWLLSCALLITCLSGLTLVSSAAETDVGKAELYGQTSANETTGIVSGGDYWIGFKFNVPKADGYHLKMTVYSKGGGNTWWQLGQVANSGNAEPYADEQGRTYGNGDGFQVPPTWRVNADDKGNNWKYGYVSYANLSLKQDRDWGTDLWFHMSGDAWAIQYAEFEITAADGTKYVRTWGVTPEEAKQKLTDNVSAVGKILEEQAENKDMYPYWSGVRQAYNDAKATLEKEATDGEVSDALIAFGNTYVVANSMKDNAKPENVTTIGNSTHVKYYTFAAKNGGVIENPDDLNGSNIGNAPNGTFLDYMINVEEAGDYQVSAVVSNPDNDNPTFSLRTTDNTVLATFKAKRTRNWPTYGTVTADKTVTLKAGPQVVRFYMETNGNFRGLIFNRVATDETVISLPAPNLAPRDSEYGVAEIVTHTDKNGGEREAIRFNWGSGFNYSKGQLAEVFGIEAGESFDMNVTMDILRDDEYSRNYGDWIRLYAYSATDTDGYNGLASDGFAPFNQLGLWGGENENVWSTSGATLGQAQDAAFGVGEYDFRIYGESIGCGDDIPEQEKYGRYLYVSHITIVVTTKDGKRITGIWGSDADVDNDNVGNTLTLNGNIDLNAYVPYGETFAKDGAKAYVTVGNHQQTKVEVKYDTRDKVNYAVVTAPVAAKEMTDDVTIVLVDGNGKMWSDTYTVKEVADKYLADPTTYANEQDLVKAMLNYGGYAQTYFNGYNSDKMANEGLDMTAAMNAVTVDTLAKYKKDSQDGLYGANLSLESTTTLRLFDAELKVIGEQEILAGALLENVEIKGYTYNPMTYCYNALRSTKTSQALKDVARALYLYGKAAAEYKPAPQA